MTDKTPTPTDKARTDAEFLKGYEQHLADSAAALLASLPPRRTRTRKTR